MMNSLGLVKPDALVGQKVRVYRNLHKDCFSVMLLSTRRVVMHAECVVLKDVQFVVSQRSRARAIREKRRNVHAFVQGTFVLDDVTCKLAVSYNPFDGKPVGAFYQKENGLAVYTSPFSICKDCRVFVQ